MLFECSLQIVLFLFYLFVQAMLEDKLRATDWEATNEAIEEQVARDSYLQFLRDNEKREKAMVMCIIGFFTFLLHIIKKEY